MAGAYPRREDDANASVREQAKAAADSYAQSFKDTKDPLMGLIRDIAGGTADLGGKLRDVFAGRTSSGSGSEQAPADGQNRDGDA